MVDAGYREAEGLGDALRMQQLKMQLRMTINAILDARVHAHGMTEDEAMTLMMQRGHQEEGEAAGKWRRAQLTSAQLSTYFVGYLEVRDLARDLAAARPGTIGAGAPRRDALARLARRAPPARPARALTPRNTASGGRMETQAQGVVPMLAYADGPAAMAWLSSAFGFEERERWLDDSGVLTHGEMSTGAGLVMLATPTPDYEGPRLHRSHCDAAAAWAAAPMGDRRRPRPRRRRGGPLRARQGCWGNALVRDRVGPGRWSSLSRRRPRGPPLDVHAGRRLTAPR